MVLIMVLFKVQAMLCRGLFGKKPRAPCTHQGKDTLITLSTPFTKPSPLGTAAAIMKKPRIIGPN